MAKQVPLTIDGEVNEALGNAMFRVTLKTGHEVTAHLSGKMRLNNINIQVGDSVTLEMSVYDLGKGRIVRRIRKNE
jgi:translation initiation factor IF-1